MPKVSKKSATKGGDHGPVVDRAEPLAAATRELRRGFARHRRDARCSGAPSDDRCQCPHWGYVIKGKMTCASPIRGDLRGWRGLLRAAATAP